MALQKVILKRGVDLSIKVGDEEKNWTSATGAIAGGIPGKIYDVAYGPVVHTGSLEENADIGTFVPGKGVIINAPEYAMIGTADGALVPSLTLRKGMVVEYMTAGHVWIKSSQFDKVIGSGKMAGRKLFGSDPVEGAESITDEYAKGTKYNLDAKFWRKDLNGIKTYYKVTTAVEVAQNTGWDAMIGKVVRLGADSDLMVVEVNGFAA